MRKGDVYRMAAELVERGEDDCVLGALWDVISEFWAVFPEGLIGDKRHRLTALLLAAAMADAGDL